MLITEKIPDCDNREVKFRSAVLGLAACHTNRNAGTGMCVHIPFRLDPIDSLAWLGKQLPCPLHVKKVTTTKEVLHLFRCVTHTHTSHHTRHTSHVSHVISDVGQIDAAQAHEFASPAPSWAWDQYLGEHPQSLSSAKKVQRNPTAFHSFPMLSDD